jgi:hypothetical protein
MSHARRWAMFHVKQPAGENKPLPRVAGEGDREAVEGALARDLAGPLPYMNPLT